MDIALEVIYLQKLIRYVSVEPTLQIYLLRTLDYQKEI